MNTSQRLKELFERHYQKLATDQEKEELMQMLIQAEHDEQLPLLIKDAWERLNVPELVLPEDKTEAILKKILKTNTPAEVIEISRLRRIGWKKWAVAASIIFVIGIGSYFLFFNKSGKQPEVIVKEQKHDVAAPTAARATLKLDDGSIVYLDSVGNGQLAMQGNVSVVKNADGKISYQSTVGSEQLAVKYNTISNPRGSKVQMLTLTDGTQVWLNAESSITYPTVFIGNERKVSITGEAYFEVTHDVSKKFIVDANGTKTEVLGTHFNVNAYSDEDAVRVTLLEGSVKVSKSNGSGKPVVIKPGEQAIAKENGELSMVNNVDLQQVVAWKEGWFEFDNVSMEIIMRQVSRWYDLEIKYQVKPSVTKYGGRISRELSLSAILEMLEKSGAKFSLEGKTLTVVKADSIQ